MLCPNIVSSHGSYVKAFNRWVWPKTSSLDCIAIEHLQQDVLYTFKCPVCPRAKIRKMQGVRMGCGWTK